MPNSKYKQEIYFDLSPKLHGQVSLLQPNLRSIWGHYRMGYGNVCGVSSILHRLLRRKNMPMANEDAEDIKKALEILDKVSNRMLLNWHQEVKPKLKELRNSQPKKEVRLSHE